MDWMKTQIWPSVQPVLRETDHTEYPYAISGGTIFLVAYGGRGFAITARHALYPLTPLLLFATDSSRKPIPLENVFCVPREKLDDDLADFAIIEIDMRKVIRDPEFSSLRFIDLGKVSGDWLNSSSEAVFIVYGYPLQHSEIQAAERSIIAARFMLRGQYRGVSEHSSWVHKISVSHDDNVTDFNGFSGSPVFSFVPNERRPERVFLCGMAIRGSCVSGVVHFLDREALLSGIHAKPAPFQIVRKAEASI